MGICFADPGGSKAEELGSDGAALEEDKTELVGGEAELGSGKTELVGGMLGAVGYLVLLVLPVECALMSSSSQFSMNSC